VELSRERSTHFVAMLGSAYARAHRRTEALEIVNELRARAEKGFVSAFDMANLYIALGDKERALARLEQGYAQRDVWLIELKAWPSFDSLASDPRFQAVVRGVGFPSSEFCCSPSRSRSWPFFPRRKSHRRQSGDQQYRSRRLRNFRSSAGTVMLADIRSAESMLPFASPSAAIDNARALRLGACAVNVSPARRYGGHGAQAREIQLIAENRIAEGRAQERQHRSVEGDVEIERRERWSDAVAENVDDEVHGHGGADVHVRG